MFLQTPRRRPSTRRERPRKQAHAREELRWIRDAAAATVRAGRLRIAANTAVLQRWRAGAIERGDGDWFLGEVLDVLARTGDLPRYHSSNDHSVTAYAERVCGFEGNAASLSRLFTTPTEIGAAAVLLIVHEAWNLSVPKKMDVPPGDPTRTARTPSCTRSTRTLGADGVGTRSVPGAPDHGGVAAAAGQSGHGPHLAAAFYRTGSGRLGRRAAARSQAKGAADADVRTRVGLDWTILQPGNLSDAPDTGNPRPRLSLPHDHNNDPAGRQSHDQQFLSEPVTLHHSATNGNSRATIAATPRGRRLSACRNSDRHTVSDFQPVGAKKPVPCSRRARSPGRPVPGTGRPVAVLSLMRAGRRPSGRPWRSRPWPRARRSSRRAAGSRRAGSPGPRPACRRRVLDRG